MSLSYKSLQFGEQLQSILGCFFINCLNWNAFNLSNCFTGYSDILGFISCLKNNQGTSWRIPLNISFNKSLQEGVTYKRRLLTRSSTYSDLTRKLLEFWKRCSLMNGCKGRFDCSSLSQANGSKKRSTRCTFYRLVTMKRVKVIDFTFYTKKKIGWEILAA